MKDTIIKKLLQDLTNVVAHHSQYAWDQLKWEISDYGYQEYYPTQLDFEIKAKHVLSKLPEVARAKLIQHWKETHPGEQQTSDEAILDNYSYIITERIITRARVAGMRTMSWE